MELHITISFTGLITPLQYPNIGHRAEILLRHLNLYTSTVHTLSSYVSIFIFLFLILGISGGIARSVITERLTFFIASANFMEVSHLTEVEGLGSAPNPSTSYVNDKRRSITAFSIYSI